MVRPFKERKRSGEWKRKKELRARLALGEEYGKTPGFWHASKQDIKDAKHPSRYRSQ